MRRVGGRIASVVPTLLVVLLFAMTLVDLPPGDPATVLAGDGATSAQIQQVRERYDLDQPVLVRYKNYIGGLLDGDLGESYRGNQPVASMIGRALPVTASLILWSLILSLLIGIPAGLIAALKRDKLADRLVTGFSSLFIGVPPFVFALVLVVVFAVTRHWLPATGYVPFADDPVGWARHLFLPGLALAIPAAAEIARQLRESLIDTLDQTFIRAQYAKGLSPARIVGRHGLKNSAIPVVTVLGLQIGGILGGAVVVEQVFVLPGFGYLGYSAVVGFDYPVIQGVVVVAAVLVLLTNLLVDLSYQFFDPRVRHGN
jgi:peptide/nickel transport system permease protein